MPAMRGASRKTLALAVFLLPLLTDAFSTPKGSRRERSALDAMPPMIIGGMVRKYQEEKLRKKMPMASEEEQRGQAPGLRVGGSSWKWPPLWPYDDTFFLPKEDVPKPSQAAQLNNMAGMLSGMPQIPKPDEIEADESKDTFDPLRYWGEEKCEVRTELDEKAAEKLRR